MAGILRLEKYSNIQPQAPLGGGDDGADILCERGRYRWVCAVFFPPTEQMFNQVETKFASDLAKAKAHNRNGFVFMTNQRLTRGQRKTLIEAAADEKQECDVYDVERMRSVLDSPEGYGVRVAYLRISMTPEEQVAFFASRENHLADEMAEHTRHMHMVLRHLEHIRAGQDFVAHTMDVIAKVNNLTVEPPRLTDPLAIGEITSDGEKPVIGPLLGPDLVRVIHRLVCFDLPSRMVGHFRTEKVMIARGASAPEEPTIAPPAPADIPKLIEELCARWRDAIAKAPVGDAAIDAIARFFHGLTAIHPFLDGNGRVARSILMQQCVECFGRVDMSRFDRGVNYFAALQAADQGDFEPLKARIENVISE